MRGWAGGASPTTENNAETRAQSLFLAECVSGKPTEPSHVRQGRHQGSAAQRAQVLENITATEQGLSLKPSSPVEPNPRGARGSRVQRRPEEQKGKEESEKPHLTLVLPEDF